MKKIWTFILSVFGIRSTDKKQVTPPVLTEKQELFMKASNHRLDAQLDELARAKDEQEALACFPPQEQPVTAAEKELMSHTEANETVVFYRGQNKTQREVVVDVLTKIGSVSVKTMKKHGVTRTQKIVSELRKKGWLIKTQILTENGVKTDIIYTLQEHPNLPVA